MSQPSELDEPGEVIEPGEVAAVFGPRAELAWRYHEMLAGRAIEWGLLGPREAGRLWCRHICNSVAVQEFVPQGASVLDVGSGAGLPGIPLALARPDLRVTLLESLLRRYEFLRLAVDELGLGAQVRVVRGRAEDVSEWADVVVARAVAPLDRLVGWCAPLMSLCLLAIKGESAEEELTQARKTLKKLGLVGRVVVADGVAGCGPVVVVRVERV